MSHSTAVYRPQGGDTLNIQGAGAIVEERTAKSVVVGTAAGLSLASGRQVHEAVQHVQFVLDGHEMTIVRGSNAGHGSLKLCDLPAGGIIVIGGKLDLDIVRVGTNIAAAWDGDAHVGTTAQTNVAVGSIVATEHNIIPTTPIAQAVSGAASKQVIDGPILNPLDGTSGALDAFLNILIDLSDISTGNDAVTIDGTVDLWFIPIGGYAA